MVEVSKEDLASAIASWRKRFGEPAAVPSATAAPSAAVQVASPAPAPDVGGAGFAPMQRLEAEFPRAPAASPSVPPNTPQALRELRFATDLSRPGQGGGVSAPQQMRMTSGIGLPVMAHVARIASDWFGKRGNARDQLSQYENGVPTPEAIRAAAVDLDLDVITEARPLASLRETDFPCIMLLRNGHGHLLLGRPQPHVLSVDIDGRTQHLDIAGLQDDYAGTVFLVKPRITSSDHQQSLPARFLARLGAGASIFQEVMNHAFKYHRPLMVQLCIAALLSNLLMLSLPLFSMAVYDRVIPHQAYDTLWALAIGVCIALSIDYALRFVRLKLTDAIGVSTALSLQAQFYRRLLRCQLADAPKSAGGISNNMRDLEGMCHLLPALFVGVAVDVPFFLLMLVLLTALGSWVVAAPVLGVLAMVVIHNIGHKAGLNTSVRASNLNRMQSNLIIDTINSLEHVKANIAEQKLLNSWERLADATGFAGHHSRLWAGFSVQATLILAQVVIVIAIIIGTYEIGNAGMTVGALTASTLIIARAMSPMGNLIAQIDKVLHLGQSVEVLSKLFSARTEEAGDTVTGFERKIVGRIDFNHVSFAYEEGGNPILSGVSLSIQPGERVGIIGRVGSGKSTVLRLMTRLLEPTSGTILVDSHDIRQMPPRALRSQITYMRQETALFDDTLLANLTFGLDRVEQEDLERAVTISGVREFATRHPKGYGLMVGVRGENLSGGERQAVMMARALLADARVLVLDEPTSALDNGAEARLVRELRPYIAGRGLIVATHRAPLLDLVDRIIWMDGGKIIADGPKAEVMKRLTGAAA